MVEIGLLITIGSPETEEEQTELYYLSQTEKYIRS